MLKHQVIGPREDGTYVVGYPTPGCGVMTTVCECQTKALAEKARDDLNKEQVDHDAEIIRDQQLRGLRIFRPLGGI